MIGPPGLTVAATLIGIAFTFLGIVSKIVFDAWTNTINRRRELEKHVTDQIEKMVPAYNLMSHHADLLSYMLYSFVEAKREVRIQAKYPGTEGLLENIKTYADDVAKAALFYVGKLYRVITNTFWKDGGDYFLPDGWAKDAVTSLHNDLMSHLRFNPNVLLKYIETDTQEYQFYEALEKAEKHNEFQDLRDEFARYLVWLMNEDKEVILVAAYSAAYSNLFDLQLERLYKDWYRRRLGWLFRWLPLPKSWFRQAKTTAAKDAQEPARFAPLLKAETRELLDCSVATRKGRELEQSRLILSEISRDATTIS